MFRFIELNWKQKVCLHQPAMFCLSNSNVDNKIFVDWRWSNETLLIWVTLYHDSFMNHHFISLASPKWWGISKSIKICLIFLISDLPGVSSLAMQQHQREDKSRTWARKWCIEQMLLCWLHCTTTQTDIQWESERQRYGTTCCSILTVAYRPLRQ